MDLDRTLAPIQLPNSTIFRYFLTGDFVAGAVVVEFLAGSFQSVEMDEAGIESSDTTPNLGEFEGFIVQQLTADLADPMVGDLIGVDAINGRGFIDVDIVVPGYASDLVIASVTDLDPEFTVVVDSPTNVTLVLDDSQAPLLLGFNAATDTYTFRYWYNGSFESGDVTLTFINNSFTYEDKVGGTVGNFADFSADVEVDGADIFVLVAFGTNVEASGFMCCRR